MSRRWLMPSVLVTLVFILALAVFGVNRAAAQMGPMMGPPLDQRSGDDFDRAFLMEMTMHHGMAVVMARPTVANAVREETRDLASTIVADQTREIAQMRAWARDWYGMDLSDPVAMMDAMSGGQGVPSDGGHADHGGMSKPQGMAKPGGMPMGQMHDMSMMGDLSELPPARLEAVFMSLMIPHHQGAIDMAMLVPDRAAHQELRDLASTIIDSQSAEINQMNGWLGAWYGL